MLFFFHLNESGFVTRDLEGREMTDVSAAREAAINDARAIMCDDLSTGNIRLSSYIDVETEEGEHLAKVTFSEAVSFM